MEELGYLEAKIHSMSKLQASPYLVFLIKMMIRVLKKALNSNLGNKRLKISLLPRK